MTSRVTASRVRVISAALGGLVLVAIAGGCTGSGGPAEFATGGTPTGTPEPPLPSGGPGPVLAGSKLYLDPDNPAAEDVTDYTAEGQSGDARQLRKISTRPVAHWLTDPDPQRSRTEAGTLVARADQVHQMPLLVVYFIPQRDCGADSAGATDAAHYRQWVRAVAAGIGDRPATVVLEPDAVAQTLDNCDTERRQERYQLLAEAATVLRGAGARVYLDAGNPEWIKDVKALAGALRAAGVEHADGFALNVSDFVRTDENVDYGRRLSDELGGKHFVIDTSRNGNGPWDGPDATKAPDWCNPPGRALGRAPTTRTGISRVDALLWVKRPGESDGPCRPGAPAAGQWWPEYALDLARRSS